VPCWESRSELLFTDCHTGRQSFEAVECRRTETVNFLTIHNSATKSFSVRLTIHFYSVNNSNKGFTIPFDVGKLFVWFKRAMMI
jgi:hypothetical protein